MARDREKDSDGFKAGNWGKCFIEVYPFNLSIHLSNKSCFISDHRAMFVWFVLEDPLCADDIVVNWSGNQIPDIITSELMQLIMHSGNPAVIFVSILYWQRSGWQKHFM
jgi:hypothetical protein